MSDYLRKTMLWIAVLLMTVYTLIHPSGVQAQTPPSDEVITEGALLYEQNCVMCHGPNGEGRVGATLAKDWPSIRPDLTIRSIITNGVPGSTMPAWSEAKGGPLSAAQIDSLVAFILSWQRGEGQILTVPTATWLPAITPIPKVSGDPNRGAILFDQNCAVCHGTNGEGRVGAVLAKDWPAIRPDLSIKNTIENGIPGSVMPAWGKDQGGPLLEADINDLTAFILSWQRAERPNPIANQQPVKLRSALLGWLGVVVFVVLLAIVLGFASWIQRKKS